MVLLDEDHEHDLYTPGTIAPSVRYQRVDVPFGRTVVLEAEDYLPASLDGRVALYRRVVQTAGRSWSGSVRR